MFVAVFYCIFWGLVNIFRTWSITLQKMWRSSYCPGGPSSSAGVHVVLVHDIKEVESERQLEVQEDKRWKREKVEVDAEVGERERVTQRAHETCRWRWDEHGTNLSHSVCTKNQSTDKENSKQQRRDTTDKRAQGAHESSIVVLVSVHMLQVCGHIKLVVLVALHSFHHFACCQCSHILTFHLCVNSL